MPAMSSTKPITHVASTRFTSDLNADESKAADGLKRRIPRPAATIPMNTTVNSVMKRSMIVLRPLPAYFLRTVEIVTAIATSKVALTPEAEKKKLDAVSGGTCAGTTVSATTRVKMLITMPNIEPMTKRLHLDGFRDKGLTSAG